MNSVVGVAPDVDLHVLDHVHADEGVGVAIQDDLGVGDVLDDGGEVLVQLLHLDGHVGGPVGVNTGGQLLLSSRGQDRPWGWLIQMNWIICW